MSEPVLDPNTYVETFARGLAVIEAFGGSRKELSVSEVAAQTGISRAAARRLLLTLVHLRYAVESGSGFMLTARSMRLGYAYLASFSWPEIAQPIIDELARISGESCSVCVLDDTEVVYVARVSTRRVISLNLSVGTRLPAWATAHGRMLLSELPPAELRERLMRSNVGRLTRFSRHDLTELEEDIRRAGDAGWSYVDQELELGLRAIAVPVRDRSGAMVAAINLAGHADRITKEALVRQYLPPLREAASEISSLLRMR